MLGSYRINTWHWHAVLVAIVACLPFSYCLLNSCCRIDVLTLVSQERWFGNTDVNTFIILMSLDNDIIASMKSVFVCMKGFYIDSLVANQKVNILQEMRFLLASWCHIKIPLYCSTPTNVNFELNFNYPEGCFI